MFIVCFMDTIMRIETNSFHGTMAQLGLGKMRLFVLVIQTKENFG